MQHNQSASLFVLNQTCIAEETYTRNGIQKNVRVVIKNQPFTMVLGLGNVFFDETQLTFKNITIEANLLYDVPGEKEVQCIQTPLEYSGRVDPNNSSLYELEVKLKVLSSQHEDSLFKLRIRALHNLSTYPFLQVTSNEILVISKPEVLRKKNEPKRKKRTREDLLLESLSRIEHRLDGQQKQIDRLTERREKMIPTKEFSTMPLSIEDVPSSCEDAVLNLINAFAIMPQQEMLAKSRKILVDLTAEDRWKFLDIVQSFWSEGLLQTSTLKVEQPSFEALDFLCQSDIFPSDDLSY